MSETARTPGGSAAAAGTLGGRVAWVTGGASGIGLAVAHALARAGARVAVTSRDADRCHHACEELRAHGATAHAVPADVTDPSAVAAAARDIQDHLGGMQVLVTAAGRLVKSPVTELDPRDLAACLRTNVEGTVYACQAVIPGMVGAGFGRIITVGSVFSLVGAAGRAAYAASKGAVAQFTRSLALELAESGVTVNCVAPGPVATAVATGDPADSAVQRMLGAEVPMDRWGAPQEIGDVVAMLASPATSYLTGAVISIDGGYVAH